MFKLNNIRVLLTVSLVLFVFYSMVNAAETGSSLSLIQKMANRTKRQTDDEVRYQLCRIDGKISVGCEIDQDCTILGCDCKLNKLNCFL